jgi:DHA1 family tetracycline resistance protein-like MFS transporter
MKKPSLLIIFLTVFLDLIGFGIVMPLLPIYGKTMGAQGFMIGAIFAVFSLMQFLFAPAWGRLSDRIGRRPVILIGNAGSAIAYALFAIASGMSGSTGLIVLMLSRVFAGICGATLSVASAYIADISPPEKRSKSMGLIGMAFGLGFIFGPALGSFTASKFGVQGPGWTAALFCGANFLLGCFILAESRKPTSEEAVKRPRMAQWTHTLRLPTVGFLIAVYFLATFCFTCFETTFGLLVNDRFHYDQTKIGYLFTYCGLLAAFLQGGAIGRLVKSVGEPRLISLSLIVTAISLALLPYFTTLGGLLLGLGLFAAGSGINRPPTFGMISLLSPANEQGQTLGVAQSAASLARILGPLFATSIYVIRPSLPYLVCGAVALIAGVLAWYWLCRAPVKGFGKSAQSSV